MDAVAGVVVLFGALATVVALVALHLLPTGLSPLRDPVSQYGITRHRLGYRIATLATGVAGIALAAGVQSALSDAVTATVLLVVFGAARLLISWFPMDEPGTTVTPTGRRHGLLAVVAFTAVAASSLKLAAALRATGQWSDVVGAIRVTGWWMVGTLLATLVARRTSARSYFGLAERAFYVGMLAFLTIGGVALLEH